MKERQVNRFFILKSFASVSVEHVICSIQYYCKNTMVILFFLPLMQNKAMQDPEIQNILTDPIMRQVTIDVCIWSEL